jgi:uncharacterized membrane protein
MSSALEVLLLWLAFGATHIGVSSQRIRPRLVGVLGERPFQGLYSIVALALFIPLVGGYFANRHAGPWLWELPESAALVWTLNLGMGVAFVLLVNALVRRSPTGLVPGGAEVHGIDRITRHPMVMATVIFGLLHLLPNGAASDVAFFGGFVGFGLLGAWHQDQRKLASAGEAYRSFHAATPFLPFTGQETLRGLRELSPPITAAGVGLAVLVRYFHPAWFGS